MRKMVASVLSLILLSGCATMSSAPIQQQRTSAVILAPKDKVWPVLVTVVAANYPIHVVEKDSGLLTTQSVAMPVGFNNAGMNNYILPPGGFLSTWEGLRMNMQIVVIESEPGKTMVNITTHYEAFESNVSNSWVVVSSNGSIENQILTIVEQQVTP